MKTCYLDANLLLYFNNPDSPFHSQAGLIFRELVNDSWKLYLSPLVLDEYFHNTLRFTKLSRKEALQVLTKSFNKIIKLPNIRLINSGRNITMQRKVLSLMAKYGLRARDAYHLFILKENKIKYLATFDDDFKAVFERGSIKKFVV